MSRIVTRATLNPTTFLWELDAPDVARAAQAGQFVMVRLHDGSERIPLTIADFDRDRGTVTVVVQALGRSTIEMRDRYREGDDIADFVGPLGVAPTFERLGHVVLVGGGLGVAPVYPQLRAAADAGNRTTVIVGFRTADLVFWLDRLEAVADRVILCTDDGSAGRPGFVTDALADLIDTDRPDHVIAIGPLPMMRACTEVTRPAGVPTTVSLNSIMVDGTGMCGSCRVSIDGVTRFACVDGPDFDAHAVDFAELLTRQRRFVHDERRAQHDYEHRCQVEHQLFVDGRRTYKKVREVEPTKVPMPVRDPVARARTFDEVALGYSLGDALREAERCLQCARPTCIAGCPVSVDIPRFIRHLLVHDVDGALDVIHETNVLPSVCGRVCPQESQCESQCVIGRKLEPVAIGRLERFVGDHGRPRRHGTGDDAATPELAGRRVAVVGSGPAGLACAADLARLGVEVTVYEALHVAGGVLRYGIPSFRLPREIIDREVAALHTLGVRFETDVVIGRTFTVEQLMSERGYDSVFLGVGAGAPSFLGIPGENAGQVSSANEFLTRVNLMGGDRFPYLDTPVGLGDDVVVVGAGNTAMDCLRVAKRLGARRVRCVYRRTRAEAPARAEELEHAEEEGIDFLFLHSPVEVLTDADGDVCGMRVERMELGEPDERGRRRPVGTGELLDLDCDSVIVALGTNANPIVTRSTPGLQLDSRGYVAADPVTQATNLPGVFAGGDIVTGGATVILAMGAGRRAAAAIADHLRGATPASNADDRPTGAADDALLEHRCARCRRPLDDDAVCCAGDSVAWRCTDCHKRSEGFAFPYGRCPACGGELERLDPVGTDTSAIGSPDDATRDALRRAFEIELGGRDYYVAAADDARSAGDDTMAELFSRLAAMELEHIATLELRYHVPAHALVTDGAVRRASLHLGDVDASTALHDPAALLRLAVSLERRAERFFRAHVDGAPPSAAALYRELAAEEAEHVDLLTTALDALGDGRAMLI
ncbi:MAG: NADPH-dependent glutamate synthase [Acidimicrobiales bacterium]|nr:NADPH-dependent glutamate synthase [Acidimicrobiales bacterium]